MSGELSPMRRKGLFLSEKAGTTSFVTGKV